MKTIKPTPQSGPIAAPEKPQPRSWLARNTTLKALGIASLSSQILIVVTGGTVRLTQSGLGCDSWPNCTPDHLFPVPESGVHAFIEFGNRLMTFVLLLIAALTIISARKNRRRSVTTTAWLLLFGIPGQAIIGLITVYTKLNPWVVGLHFILSMALITLATIQLNRIYGAVDSARHAVRGGSLTHLSTHSPAALRTLGTLAFLSACLSIIFGIIVTGSGPHAGDAEAPRNGLDSGLWTRIHTIPAYVLVIATVGLLILVLYRSRDCTMTLKATTKNYILSPIVWLLLAEITQGTIGYAQHLLGLPVALVSLHLCGAALLMSSSTNVVQRLHALKHGETDVNKRIYGNANEKKSEVGN